MREQSRPTDRPVLAQVGSTAARLRAEHCGSGEKPVRLVGPLGSECSAAHCSTERIDESTLVLRVGVGLLGGDQGGAHPDSVGAHTQGSRCEGPVGYATC